MTTFLIEAALVLSPFIAGMVMAATGMLDSSPEDQ